MLNVCGKIVEFQENRLGFFPTVSDQQDILRIPLLLGEHDIKMSEEFLKKIPSFDYPLHFVAQIVAGGISFAMKYKGS